LGPPLLLALVLSVSLAMIAMAITRSPARPPRPVLISSGTWAPYVDPSLPRAGPVAELVTVLLQRLGYEPEIAFTSWPLAQARAERGEAFGVFPLVASEARRASFVLSEPLVEFDYALFYDTQRGELVIESEEDLAALSVGRIDGYDYWPELEAAVDEFVLYDSSLEAFRALAAGEIDVVPEGILPGRAVILDPELAADAADFAIVGGDGPLVRSTEGLHLMMPVSREAEAMMSEFDTALARFKDTTEYAEIVSGLEHGTGLPTVTLLPAGDTGLVELLDPVYEQVLYSPPGTLARVLAWGAGFDDPQPEPPIMVEVKVLNGPAQGRLVLVDARYVQLDAS
jgi:polar amino acid transport system substrate-binding protein